MRTDHRFAGSTPSKDSFSIRVVAGGILVALIMLFFASSASACPVTDPKCAIDEATKTVEDIAKDPVGKIKDTVDTVEDTTSKVVDDVNKTVDDTVDTVEDTVRTKPDVPDNPENPKKSDVPQPPRVKSDNLNPRDKGKPNPGGNKKTSPGRDARVRAGEGTLVGGPVTLKSDDVPVAPAASATQSVERQGLAEAAIEAARKFAFPLLLTLIVGFFLAVQNRVDRKHPKLALAPLDQDLLSFR